MSELIRRIITNRAQPLGIISAVFIPELFGIHIPWLSAMFIFQPIILLIAAITNFCFFLVLDLHNKESPEHLRSFWIIYTFFVGVLAVEILPLYVGVLGSIFSAANAETIQQKSITELVVIYGFVGSTILDVYMFYTKKIVSKLQSILKIE